MLFDTTRKLIKKFLILFCIVFLIFLLLPALSVISGPTFAALNPYCDAQVFGKKEPTAINITLPDLHHLSQKERILLVTGSYKLSSEYNLKMIQDGVGMIKLCVSKRHFTTVSACFEIGSDLEQVVICGPDMRPDCLPGSIVEHYVGASFWYQDNSTVIYIILDIDSSVLSGFVITNMTKTLSSCWYDTLRCQDYVHLQVLTIVAGVLGFSCCLVLSFCCLGVSICFSTWVCHQRHKQKR